MIRWNRCLECPLCLTAFLLGIAGVTALFVVVVSK